MTKTKQSLLDKASDAYAAATGKSAGHRARAASLRPLARIAAVGSDAGAQVGDAACRARTCAPEAYPTHSPQGGPSEFTPINNMGVTNTGGTTAPGVFQDIAISQYVDIVMSDSGEVKQLLSRVPTGGQCAIIDWVNFTVLEDTWNRTARTTLISDEQYIVEASRHLEKIFGFGITDHRERGMNFYRDSWVLGDEFGFVCFGGQRNTMLVTLNGLGCASAIQGWEKRLYDFITNTAIRPVLSRVDVAHDDFDGAMLSVDWAEEQWHSGGYTMSTGGIAPSIERIGNWHRPSGKGRTLTIGRRTSGKFTRFYEKGKKEGDKLSPWLRAEVEFKSSDRVIPFEILLSPSDYFCATYPCFIQFAQVEAPKRMEVKQKTAQVVIDACVEVTKHQFGKYLRVFRELWGDKETLDLVCNADKDAWPKRMKPLTSDAQTSPVPVHREIKIPSFVKFISSVPSFGLNGDNGFSQARAY